MRPRAVLKAVLMASKVMQVSPVGPGIIRPHPLGVDEDELDLGGWLNLWELAQAAMISTAMGNRNVMSMKIQTRQMEMSFKVFLAVARSVLKFFS
jgi:hypothetical protein